MLRPSAKALDRMGIENDLGPVRQLAPGCPRLTPDGETLAASHRVACLFLRRAFSPAGATVRSPGRPPVVPQGQSKRLQADVQPRWRAGTRQELLGPPPRQPAGRPPARPCVRFGIP